MSRWHVRLAPEVAKTSRCGIWGGHDTGRRSLGFGHVGTHLLASLAQRGYTAGVATALPVMLPGAESARREIREGGEPLEARDYVAGVAMLLPAAIVCQVLARVLVRPRSA